MMKFNRNQAALLAALMTVSAPVTTYASATTAATATTATTAATATAATATTATTSTTSTTEEVQESTTDTDTITSTADGEHAIEADGTSDTYSGTTVTKTGDSEGDEADFYGENAAIFATNGATLDLTDMTIDTDGTHANAVFSYGEGTTVNISDSVITTSDNCSGGLMTTGGGTMNASNLTINTSGNSSAAIRSDRGGGTVTVDGGSYTTTGTGSPAIYSTADITVNDATLESTSSQGVVVEGKNSATLNNVTLIADNNTKNSDKSDYYQAVMIYQSMSGDADTGEAVFTMNDGTLTNANGDIFFVNNTVATINLTNATLTNNGSGVFLRAAAAGWGTEGENGGQVTLNASNQTIDGDMVVDSVSNLNLYLTDASIFTGSINPDGQDGEVYVEISDDSTWVLTSDAYIASLTCDADAIDLNGNTLYVDGEAYVEGTESTGEAIEVTVSESSGHGGEGAPDGKGKPDGEAPDGMEKPDGEAPDGKEKPDGEASDGKEKPDGDASDGMEKSDGEADDTTSGAE